MCSEFENDGMCSEFENDGICGEFENDGMCGEFPNVPCTFMTQSALMGAHCTMGRVFKNIFPILSKMLP